MSIVVHPSPGSHHGDDITAQVIFSDSDDVPRGRGIDGSSPLRENILPFMKPVSISRRMPRITNLPDAKAMNGNQEFLVRLFCV